MLWDWKGIIYQSINQLIDQSIDQSIKQPTNQYLKCWTKMIRQLITDKKTFTAHYLNNIILHNFK